MSGTVVAYIVFGIGLLVIILSIVIARYQIKMEINKPLRFIVAGILPCLAALGTYFVSLMVLYIIALMNEQNKEVVSQVEFSLQLIPLFISAIPLGIGINLISHALTMQWHDGSGSKTK
ncbi:hypothetical protein [Snodgrassella sp. CFCC 13594]|uniref:hypothetical protein n=1 Tax=Snodgrassella sp. CFCC 13594 TaxID=1775559 RepID=UPI000829BA80|nr:hypothetical protein [Snodgrassella sp. CFCC 13594]